MNIEALLLSARLALSVSAILFVVGVPLAYWLAYSRWRWKFLLEAGLGLAPGGPPPRVGVFIVVWGGAPGGVRKMLCAAVGPGPPVYFPGPVFFSFVFVLSL